MMSNLPLGLAAVAVAGMAVTQETPVALGLVFVLVGWAVRVEMKSHRAAELAPKVEEMCHQVARLEEQLKHVQVLLERVERELEKRR